MKSFFQSFRHFFAWAQKALLQNKVLTICLQSKSNFNKLSFLMIPLFEKSKIFFWTVNSNSHPAVLPKTTFHNLFQIFTPSLLMGSIVEKKWEVCRSFKEFFFKGRKTSPLKKVFTISLQSLSNFNELSFFFENFSLWKIQKQFFELFIQIHIKLSFLKLLPTIFSRFLLHLFSWVLFWREKWEVFQSLGDFFQGLKELSSKKVFTICLQSLSNFNKLSFWRFLFSKNPKTVFWTVYSSSHQKLLPKIFSRFLHHLFSCVLFGRKMRSFSIFWTLFCKVPKSSPRK